MKTKEDLIIENKELFWDIWNLSSLNDLSIEERFLKYWNWNNIKDLISLYWIEKFRENYFYIRDKKRSNLSKKTINFFNLYLNV